MISKKVPHTYIQQGTRFFALFVYVRSTYENTEIDAHNFYIFSENGNVWLEMIHVDKSYVLNQLGNGFFKTRHIIEVDEPMPAFRDPLIASDSWIQGSADKGFALETIKESLGLNILYLSEIIREEKALRETEQHE